MTPQIIFGLVIILVIAASSAVKFFSLSRDRKEENLREWLKLGVAEAEKALGSGTGQLKLRLVYATAIDKFPWLKTVPFEVFSSWVDEALEWLANQLQSNKSVISYVKEGN